jgi:osmotically inducible lipoprotein OsmB
MMKRLANVLAVSLLTLGVATTAASARCDNHKAAGTIVGAGAGGLVGSAVTHGSAAGVVGGVVLGGLAGHSIAADDCEGHYRHHRHGHYDHDHHWHDDSPR